MNKPMQALVMKQNETPALINVPLPEVPSGSVLLRVICTGLCRTDLLIADGTIPLKRQSVIAGHEFCARVSRNSDDGRWKEGDVVAVDPTFMRDDGSDGFMGRETDGCIAEYAVVPSDKLFRVPEGMDPRVAAYLEPVAAAIGGAETAFGISGHGILAGDNRIAVLTGAILRSMNLNFVHVSYEQLKTGTENGSLLNCCKWLLETRLEDELLFFAAEVLEAGGTLILKSRHASRAVFPAARWAEKRLNLAGRSRSDFLKAMKWLNENRGSVSALLGPTYSVTNWETAFKVAKSDETGKVFIVNEIPD